jgi:hypothetical protein
MIAKSETTKHNSKIPEFSSTQYLYPTYPLVTHNLLKLPRESQHIALLSIDKLIVIIAPFLNDVKIFL